MDNLTTFDVVFPLTVLFLLAVAVPFGMMFANWLLSPQTKKKSLVKGDAYECGLSHVLGLDLFAQGYGAGSIAAIAMVGLGGGLGLKLARLWRSKRNPL